MKDNTVMIEVNDGTRKELDKHRVKGESYDTLINNLIEMAEETLFK